MAGQQDVKDALVRVVSEYKDGIEADALCQALEKEGYEAELVRAALRQLLNRGRLQLGHNLALEAAA
jgi:hypothetical protein